MSESKIFMLMLSFLAFSFIKFLFSLLYPGSITMYLTSKLTLPCLCISSIHFANKKESFPPDIQTATLSPSFINS